MRRLVFSQKGFTLIELIVALVISTLLIVIAGMGLSVFFGKYQELNAYVELQKDAIEFLNYMKYGYYVGTGSLTQFYGVTSADSLFLEGYTNEPGKYNSITITPPHTDNNKYDFMNFYFFDGFVRAKWKFNNVETSSPIKIFPKNNSSGEMKVLSFKISDANANGAIVPVVMGQGLRIIKVELKAQVESRNKKVQTVDFSTLMSIHIVD